MKKIAVLVLSLMAFVVVALNIKGLIIAQTSDFWVREIDEGSVEIWNYGGSDEEVIIPSVIDGKTVTSIGYPGFSSNTSVKHVVIPNSITTINAEAFSNATALEAIDVESDNLNYSSVDGILFNKDKSELLQYPNGNPNDTYRVIDGVTTINEYAFAYTNLLKEITLSSSVRVLNNTFRLCYGLESFKVDENNSVFSAIDGVLYTKDQCQLLKYPANKTNQAFAIPSNVDYIADYAFTNNAKIERVTIPNSVTYIGKEAFAYCYNIKELTIPGSVEELGYSSFMSCSNLVSLTIQDGVKRLGNSSFSNCYNLIEVVIPKSVTYMGNLLFASCSKLENVTILSRDCYFAVCKNVVPANSSITAYDDSTAKNYAQSYGRVFNVISDYQLDCLGASIRVTNPGLRLGFSFDKTQLSNSDSIEELGFIYSNNEQVDLAITSADAKQKIADNTVDHGDYVTYNLVFTNIPASDFNQLVYVKAYVKINGQYYYSALQAKSFYEVAQAVLSDSEIDQSIKDQVEAMLSIGM